MANDTIEVKVIERLQLRKFNGDPPKPGEHKQPVQVITFGDDIPTTISDFSPEGHLLCQQVIPKVITDILEQRHEGESTTKRTQRQ